MSALNGGTLMRFHVSLDDGTDFEVSATPRDFLRWERTTKGATFQKFMQDLSMVHMYKLAFFAAEREGLFSGTLSEFEAQAMVTPSDEVEVGELDPTR